MDWRVVESDCLCAMASMPAESIDLIYADPPFCTGRDFGEFSDQWRAPDKLSFLARTAKRCHSDAMAGFVAFMELRVAAMKRLLKHTGGMYLHCDPTASHYLKLVLDSAFGRKRFRNEIAWCYTGPGNARLHFPRRHDTILFYANDEHHPVVPRLPYKPTLSMAWGLAKHDGQANLEEQRAKGKHCEDWWRITRLAHSHELVGYPTQKPLALLERIIGASSHEGDTVLDPFCGSGTTLVAAHNMGRNCIGIDRNAKAVQLTRERMNRQHPVLL